MKASKVILLVEDNEDDAFLMMRALSEAAIKNKVIHVEDGQEAVAYLQGSGQYADREKFPIPAIAFLDLKLPFKSGHDVLEWCASQDDLSHVIRVVLTSSNEPSDLKRAYALGAHSYLVKPPDAGQLLDLAKAFKWYWLEWNRPSADPVGS